MARPAPPIPGSSTHSSGGSQPPGTSATTHGDTSPAGHNTDTHTGEGDNNATTATANSGGTTSTSTKATGNDSHTASSNAQPNSTGSEIPLPTTSPQEIDLARKITGNLDKIQAKRPLNPREQADYDKARNLLDRAAPNHPGTRNTGNPKDLVLAGDGPISQTYDAAADVPPASPAQGTSAVGTTIQGPGTTNPDAPTASAGGPPPLPPTTSPAGSSTGNFSPTASGSTTGGTTSNTGSSSSPSTGNPAITSQPASAPSKPVTPPIFNKTHKNSLPKPKGVGLNGGSMQSHHGLQQEWAIHNLNKYGYNPELAPTITLETATGRQHTIITNLQRARRNARKAAGHGIWSSSLQDELGFIVSDMKAAGFDRATIQKTLEQQYSMLDKLNVPYKPIKH